MGNSEVEDKLRQECKKEPAVRNLGSNTMKILMFGQAQIGKSALVNSMLCAMTNTINQFVLAYKSNKSVTRSLFSPVSLDLKFKLTDMPGFFKESENYLTAVLSGHIKEDVIVPEGPLDESADYYIRDPQPFDRPCCVVLVMKAGRSASEEEKEKFRLLVSTAEKFKLKMAVVLTHVDRLETQKRPAISGKNVARVFHEEVVHEAVELAKTETGVPLMYIHPVVNYTNEIETVTEMNILLMYVLRKILDLAEEGANSLRS